MMLTEIKRAGQCYISHLAPSSWLLLSGLRKAFEGGGGGRGLVRLIKLEAAEHMLSYRGKGKRRKGAALHVGSKLSDLPRNGCTTVLPLEQTESLL